MSLSGSLTDGENAHTTRDEVNGSQTGLWELPAL
jgi:hypothetical protein